MEGLFRHKPICLALSPYLSLEDWVSLSCVNRFLYYHRGLEFLPFSVLVENRFGWKGVDTLAKLRKKMGNAREPVKYNARFACTCGCGGRYAYKFKVPQGILSNYALCGHCILIKAAYKPFREKWYTSHSLALYKRHREEYPEDVAKEPYYIQKYYNESGMAKPLFMVTAPVYATIFSEEDIVKKKAKKCFP